MSPSRSAEMGLGDSVTSEFYDRATEDVIASDPGSIYTPEFFDEVAAGSVASAELVVPVILDQFPSHRVLEIGCGEAAWSKHFQLHGCLVLGVDGEWVCAERLQIPASQFFTHDLRKPLPQSVFDWGADLVICLEVAEHLPSNTGPRLIDDLCRLSDVIVFSGAVPGQGGHGHINERPHEYWIELFAKNNFTTDTRIRSQIASLDGVKPWYRNNIFVAMRTAIRNAILPF